MKAFVLALALIAASLAAWGARAQSQPQVDVQIDSDTVGVGEVVHLEMQATSTETMPDGAQLGKTPGFTVTGSNASPSETHINVNGNRSDRYTLVADWVLQAQRVGTFNVGPVSVAVGGVRYGSHPVTLHVVPAGKAPTRRARPTPSPQPFPFGFSPFDPWRQLIPGMNQNGTVPQASPPVAIDPKLSLDASGGEGYFFRASVDKASAVVGEQVILSIFEYVDPTVINTEPAGDDVHEPVVADFAKHSLLPEDQDEPLAGYASVGGKTWKVRLARRWALFPLRTGDLDIGPMTVTVTRPRSIAGQKRATEALRVRVAEPPLAGRPPGYALGDVGRFALAAQVQPREIEQGGAVSVHVDLTGTGNIPSAIRPPAREGIDWLPPEVHDALGATGNESYGGRRSFDFVVRVNVRGDVPLGDFSLPFWDADQKRYDVARAALGTIHVSASPTASSRAAGAQTNEILAGLPAARPALEGTVTGRPHLDDSPWFWASGILGGPIAFGLAVGGGAVGRRLKRAVQRRTESPRAELRVRVAAARAACSGSDAREAIGAIARAIESATVAYAGVSVRGALGDQVRERLSNAGVRPETAAEVADLLRECEAARFAPDAADMPSARERWERAHSAIRKLESH